jgi:hypothetical protein
MAFQLCLAFAELMGVPQSYARLFLLRAGPHLIQPGKAWSIFQLQQDLRMKIITNEVEHTTELKLKKQYAKAS